MQSGTKTDFGIINILLISKYIFYDFENGGLLQEGILPGHSENKLSMVSLDIR